MGEAWQRFRKDTAPLFGTVVIGLVVTAAALARSEAVSSLHIGPVCFCLHFRRGLDHADDRARAFIDRHRIDMEAGKKASDCGRCLRQPGAIRFEEGKAMGGDGRPAASSSGASSANKIVTWTAS